MGGSDSEKLNEVELVEELCQFNALASHSLGLSDHALTWNQLKDLSHQFKLCLTVVHQN
jgi:hypothetical protein